MNRARARNRRHGTVVILVAVVLLVLVGFIGLALDSGVAALTLHQIQNATDAAALAGARLVLTDPNQARDAAVQLAAANTTAGTPLQLQRNDGNAPDGDIVLGRYERKYGTFRATMTVPNAVLVNGRRTDNSLSGPLPLIFGPAFEKATVNLERYAIAMNQSRFTPGVLVLSDHDACALRLGGSVELTVQSIPPYEGAAAIQVDSDNSCAVCGSGTDLTITADELDIVGENPGDCLSGHATVCDINPGSPYIPDPLAGLPDPTWGADKGSITETGTYTPGYYSGGMRLTGGKSATLEPGIYVLDGVGGGGARGVVVNGGDLNATSVLLYVIGQGVVYLGGNGQVTITPSVDVDDPYWGVSIFQARDNANPATIIGSSDMNLQGVFYFPIAPTEIGGGGGSIGNMVIAWTLYIHGDGTMLVQYDGRFGSSGSFIYLVK
jgi:Flp pilus assembly protein TadG